MIVSVVFCVMSGLEVPQRVRMLPKVRHGPSPDVHEALEHVRLLSLAHPEPFEPSRNQAACFHEAGITKGPT